ncbi:MAG: hypothetical protein L3J74_04895 [Bacteroidales bacterium]|nr:hypothetical protein [Bacteroidales bacterium]
MRTLSFLIFMLIASAVLAQENALIKIQGKALVQWYPDVESKTEAKNRALQQAKVNALQDAFGTLIMQGNTIYIENKKTGEKVETNTVFKMIGNTAVKGEIIKVLKEEYKETEKKERIPGQKKKQKVTYIECSVQLLAKELKNTKIQIETFPLKDTKIIRPVTDFYKGDDFFLYFRSPVNGYLTVYLDDNDNAQCLLPYRSMPEGLEEAMPIKADKEYVFFSDKPEFNYFDDDFFKEDTYELYANSEKDINRLYVIFSKKPLNKPILKDDEHKEVLLDLGKENYSLPRIVPSNDFQEWLIKIQQIRDDLVIKTIMISIEKNE